jgi:hypothetical protein
MAAILVKQTHRIKKMNLAAGLRLLVFGKAISPSELSW